MEDRDCPLQKKFRFLLIHIGSELHTKNCKAIKFAHNIKRCKREEDEEGLDILSELMEKGVFNAYYPDGLRQLLEMIDRKDLSNEIKHYQRSSLFKTEVKRRLVERTREHFLHTHHTKDDQWNKGNMEKFLSTMAKLLSHMTSMVDQTVALTNSVETLVNEDTGRPQILESISTTKAKMEDLSKAIQGMAEEVQHAQFIKPEEHFKRTLTEPIMDHLSVQSGKGSTNSRRGRSHSDVTNPDTTRLAHDSPTMRLDCKGQRAMMTLWSELTYGRQRRKSAGSDSGSSNRSRHNSNASASSYEEEERYVSHATGIIQKDGASPSKEDTSHILLTDSDPIYDDPDSLEPQPQLKMYINIPILSVEDTECSIVGEDHRRSCSVTYDDLDTPEDGYEAVDFCPLPHPRPRSAFS